MNQQQWESEAYTEGMDKFFDNEADSRRNGKMDETAVGSSVIKQRVLDVSEVLKENAKVKVSGKGGAYVQALRVASTRHNGEDFYQDYTIPAYIGLLTVLQACYSKKVEDSYLTSVTLEIGRRLEYDQKLYVFRKDNPAFVGKIETSLAQQGVTSLSHKLKTYQKKWRDAEMVWTDWGDVKRVQVGVRVVKALLSSMDDCFILNKKHDGKFARHNIETTVEFDDYVIDETDLISKTMPILQPLIEKPIEWTRVDGRVTGGFHTQELQSVTPFIKTRGKEHREFVEASYPYKHMSAVNTLQGTEWSINHKVVDAIKTYVKQGITFGVLPRATKLEVPEHPGDDATEEAHMQWLVDAKTIHGKNKDNTSKYIILSQSLRMVNKLGDRSFWFAYTCDFRGRIYCTSTTLSPQGADHIKAMLRFKNGKRLGRSGIKWSAINGANKYGYDKVNLNDRVRWVIDNEASIRQVVAEPTGSFARSFLNNADKPFQFLSWCFEWEACSYGTNPDAEGYLPVGLDGSCNGLQHYAALLRDTRGGKGVNLTDAPIPSDIYKDVASEFLRILPYDELGVKFHAIGVDRKLAKRPVMTLPYGSTQQSCRGYIREYIGDNAEKFGVVDDIAAQWKLAMYATPYMWTAIGTVVVAAREGMTWLQKCSLMIAKTGTYSRWMSPVDFPVYQHYSAYETVRVQTDLFGRVTLNLQGVPKGVSTYKARSGIAPNYVHSLDCSHMVLTILEAAGRGMQDLACIHDDFGTHAADTEELYDLIRITFVRMYCNKDWLLTWKKEMERLHTGLELPEPPEAGTLDVMQVLDSKYFFA